MTTKVTKYDLASRLVDREVLCCVSSLISALYEATQYPLDNLRGEEDDIRDLMSRADYEPNGRSYIDDLDVYDLQEVAELFDVDWDEFLVAQGCPTNDMLQEAIDALDERISELGDEILELRFYDSGEQQLERRNALTEERDILQDDADKLPQDLDDWCNLEDGRLEKLQKAVTDLVDDECGGWRTLGENYDIDPDYDDVYEHWAVTPWLGRKLAENGEIVRTVCNLTVWGRCCTGQAIALDPTPQLLACELWGSELTVESDPADAF